MAQAGCQEPLRREQVRGPQHHVKLAASTDLQPESRAAHVTVKAMPAGSQSGDHAAGLGGVGAQHADTEWNGTREARLSSSGRSSVARISRR